MIATWIGYALVVTTLLALVARLLDRVAELRGWQRRIVWAGALAAALACIAAVSFRREVVTPPPLVGVSAAVPTDFSTPAIEQLAVSTDAPSPAIDLLSRVEAMFNRFSQYNRELGLLWGAGSVLLIAMYAAGWWTLVRRRRNWRESGIDGCELLIAERDGPAVAGVWRPLIVLPEWAVTLDANSRTLMIAHEAEHIRVRDPLLLLGAMIAMVAMPWNIAAWWILRRLRLAVELDCDARVLALATSHAPQYGELLLTVARHRSPEFFQVAPAFLDHASSLSRRIVAMHPRTFRWPRLQSALATGVAVALLILGSAFPAPRLPAQEPGTLPLDQRAIGSAKAPVTIYEYADFQCPFCGAFSRDQFATINTEYIKTGKVRWIFMNFPLATMHGNALAAATFGACAASQDRFWPAHDMLYGTVEQWADMNDATGFFKTKIATLGIDAGKMASCLESGTGDSYVKADLARAEKLGVNSTPSFFTDEGQLTNQALPIAKFRHLLDSVYTSKTTRSAPPARSSGKSPLAGYWIRESTEGAPASSSKKRYFVALATGNRSWGSELAIDARNDMLLITGPEIAFVTHTDTLLVNGLTNRWLPGQRGVIRATPKPLGNYGVDQHISRPLWPGESWIVAPDGRTLVHKYEWKGADSTSGWITVTYRRSAG